MSKKRKNGNPAAEANSYEAVLGARPNPHEYQDIPVGTLTEWDVHAIKNTLERFEQGNFYDSALLCDYMMRDDRMSSSMGTRVRGVTGRPLVMQGDTDPEIAEAYLERRSQILPDGTEKLMRRWSIGMGFAIGEILWRTDAPVSKSSALNLTRREWLPRVKPWHPFSTYYDISKRQYVVTTMEGPQWLPAGGGDGKWIQYTPYGSYRGWMDGIVRCCAIPFLLRQYSLRDWGRYSEVHGLPTRVGKIPVNAKPADRDRFLSQLVGLVREPTLLLPQAIQADQKGFEYELVEASAGNWSAFERLIQRCEVGITLAILSQNLTSEVQGGSFAAAFVHNEVRQDVKEDDEMSFAYCEWEQLIKPWALYNYGDADKAPVCRRDVRQPEDKQAEATTRAARATAASAAATALQTFTQQGVKVNIPAYCAQYSIPLMPGQGPAHASDAPANGLRPLVPPKATAPVAIEGS